MLIAFLEDEFALARIRGETPQYRYATEIDL